MKFKLPRILTIIYNVLIFSVILTIFLPIAKGELLNQYETIGI
ncbi:MAG: hypothetical protein U9O98_01750 [Asgard group archaeon]|nr:hypothetical protein [Asgard group archaeon]